jgi:hypothetical protein
MSSLPKEDRIVRMTPSCHVQLWPPVGITSKSWRKCVSMMQNGTKNQQEPTRTNKHQQASTSINKHQQAPKQKHQQKCKHTLVDSSKTRNQNQPLEPPRKREQGQPAETTLPNRHMFLTPRTREEPLPGLPKNPGPRKCQERRPGGGEHDSRWQNRRSKRLKENKQAVRKDERTWQRDNGCSRPELPLPRRRLKPQAINHLCPQASACKYISISYQMSLTDYTSPPGNKCALVIHFFLGLWHWMRARLSGLEHGPMTAYPKLLGWWHAAKQRSWSLRPHPRTQCELEHSEMISRAFHLKLETCSHYNRSLSSLVLWAKLLTELMIKVSLPTEGKMRPYRSAHCDDVFGKIHLHNSPSAQSPP